MQWNHRDCLPSLLLEKHIEWLWQMCCGMSWHEVKCLLYALASFHHPPQEGEWGGARPSRWGSKSPAWQSRAMRPCPFAQPRTPRSRLSLTPRRAVEIRCGARRCRAVGDMRGAPTMCQAASAQTRVCFTRDERFCRRWCRALMMRASQASASPAALQADAARASHSAKSAHLRPSQFHSPALVTAMVDTNNKIEEGAGAQTG